MFRIGEFVLYRGPDGVIHPGTIVSMLKTVHGTVMCYNIESREDLSIEIGVPPSSVIMLDETAYPETSAGVLAYMEVSRFINDEE